MTDRELLELAAKAAGHEWKWDWPRGAQHPVCFRVQVGDRFQSWDPLTDDGDALRLAVKLQIIVGKYDLYANASVIGESDVDIVVWNHEVKDPYAATRRAVVRAAAAMAKEKAE